MNEEKRNEAEKDEELPTGENPAAERSAGSRSDKDKISLYIYEADDEPVDDRDFYCDYTGTVYISGIGYSQSPVSAETQKCEKNVQNTEKQDDLDLIAGHIRESAENVKEQEQTAVRDLRNTVYEQSAGSAPEKESFPRQNADIPVFNNPQDMYSDDERIPARMPKSREKERSGSGRPGISVVNTVISMITLCVTAAGMFTALAYMRAHDQQIRADQTRMERLENAIADMNAQSDDSRREYVDAVSMIDEEEKNDPPVPESENIGIENGKILTYDSYVGYSWVPVLAGVKTNQYDKSAFSVDDEYHMTYKVGGEVSSYFGIDVSSHNGDIDWNAVRADGVEFAILRIGVRGYGEEGNIKVDEKFIQNYEGARDAGIDIGVYFYSQAISVDEAVEEAKFVLEQLGGRDLEYPIAFDWEPVDTNLRDVTPRTEDVMPGTLNLAARAFCETVKDAGYKPMVYMNKKMAYLKYDLRLIADYPVWLALYNTDNTYYYDFDMWQYGFAQIDGIEGDVDVDIAIIR